VESSAISRVEVNLYVNVDEICEICILSRNTGTGTVPYITGTVCPKLIVIGTCLSFYSRNLFDALARCLCLVFVNLK
jgi:hypothetical protein